MSGILMGWVYYYDFSKPQQNVLLALADHGKEDGTHIHPSIETMMWKLHMDRRHIQRTIRELEVMGVLIPVAYATGGRGRATEYEMHLEAAPLKKEPPPGERMAQIWRMLKGGLYTALSEQEEKKGGPDTAVSAQNAKGRTFEHQKGGLSRTKGGLLNKKGGPQTAPTNSNHNNNHQIEPARTREPSPAEKKREEAEPEPEADPPPLRDAPPAGPLPYHQFATTYRKRHGFNVPSQEVHNAYSDYLYEFEKAREV